MRQDLDLLGRPHWIIPDSRSIDVAELPEIGLQIVIVGEADLVSAVTRVGAISKCLTRTTTHRQ
jgi:hypothetical protein